MKLTLSIKDQVIEQAKLYAKTQGRSLSNIVEEYLKAISSTDSEHNKKELHPLVEELWGSVKMPQQDLDYDELLKDALIQKHLK